MTLKPITIKTIVTDESGDEKNLCLNIQNLRPEECRKGDPYHIFLIYRLNKSKNLVLISPIAGRCIGVGGDGKMVFSMGCTTPDDLLLHEDDKFINQKSQCLKTGLGCGQFILEKTPDARIWWNTPALLQLEDSLRMQQINPMTSFKLANKLNVDVPLPRVVNKGRLLQKIGTDKSGDEWSWKLTITELGKESIFKKLKANSVEGDKPVVWLGYRPNQPKLIYFIGAPGSGKSSWLEGIIKCFDLVNPIILSTDNIYPLIKKYNLLMRLGEHSNIRTATDIPNLKATYLIF